MATIYDIAKDVGVSAATVSRVMNGRTGVSALTVKKIRNSMEKANFQPRWKAVERNRILLLVPEQNRALSLPYASQITTGIVDACFAIGFAVVLRPFLPNVRNGRELRQMVMQEGVGGCIMLSLHPGYDLADRIGLEKIPHVIVGHKSRDDAFNQVLLQDYQAGKEATEYLISLGHRKIAMVCFNHVDHGHAERCAGYIAAMREALPSSQPLPLQFDSADQASGEAAARRLFGAVDRPTAVIITQEHLALGFQREARALGLAIPRDVSIIGFEDGSSLSHLDTPLTVMQSPTYELGAEAANMLYQLIAPSEGRTDTTHAATRKLPLSLLVRRSTSAVR